jgi:hypothetical protein
MSLRKSPTMTPARLEANRRNARKSTGPRTARGKGWSRLNSLRTGARSSLYHGLWRALWDAPPCQMAITARSTLTPQLAAHPLFAELVDLFVEAEIAVVEESRCHREAMESRRAKRC